MPEMTLIYLNQGFLRYKNDQKIYYGDHFVLGQVMPLAGSPSDLSYYQLKQGKNFKTKI